MLSLLDAVTLVALVPNWRSALKLYTNTTVYPSHVLRYIAKRRVIAIGGEWLYFLRGGNLYSVALRTMKVRRHSFLPVLTAVAATEYNLLLLDRKGIVYSCQHGAWSKALFGNYPRPFFFEGEERVYGFEFARNELVCYREFEVVREIFRTPELALPYSAIKKYSASGSECLGVDPEGSVWFSSNGVALQALSLNTEHLALDCVYREGFYGVYYDDGFLRLYRQEGASLCAQWDLVKTVAAVIPVALGL